PAARSLGGLRVVARGDRRGHHQEEQLMNNQAMTGQGMIALAFLVVLVVLVIWGIWRGLRVSRARKLKDRFGPEYDLAQEKYGKHADHELQERVKRVERLTLRDLTAEQIEKFGAAWRSALKRFIDDPALAVAEADRLMLDILEARGYP